jgi:nicotinamide-nucleotide amidase
MTLQGQRLSQHGSEGARRSSSASAAIDLSRLAERVLEVAAQRDVSIVTAESCTAGKLAAHLSEAPGAAERLHGSFVAYTKANKTKSLGVSADLLKRKGAVCREVAVAMAEGALARSPATVAVSITGVAGPDPDEDGNPVGLVCIAVARVDGATVHLERRYGDAGRDAVQERAMADALGALIDVIESDGGLDAASTDRAAQG